MIWCRPADQWEVRGNACEAGVGEQGVDQSLLAARLLIVARGTVPEPCYEVGIDRNLLSASPPEFILYRWRTGLVCPEVVVPFTTFESFDVEAQPDSVVVTTRRAGTRLRSTRRSRLPSRAASSARSVHCQEARPKVSTEATGMSARMSFDEAFADAVSRLPEWPPAMPDEMSTVTVSDIGAWFGGIAGFHYLVVTVRRPAGGPARGA